MALQDVVTHTVITAQHQRRDQAQQFLDPGRQGSVLINLRIEREKPLDIPPAYCITTRSRPRVPPRISQCHSCSSLPSGITNDRLGCCSRLDGLPGAQELGHTPGLRMQPRGAKGGSPSKISLIVPIHVR
jgi:hypothetical protein